MTRFKYTDNSQGMFLTVNLNEQLIPGTFEWTLDYLVNKMDLSLFEQNYHNGVPLVRRKPYQPHKGFFNCRRKAATFFPYLQIPRKYHYIDVKLPWSPASDFRALFPKNRKILYI